MGTTYHNVEARIRQLYGLFSQQQQTPKQQQNVSSRVVQQTQQLLQRQKKRNLLELRNRLYALLDNPQQSPQGYKQFQKRLLQEYHYKDVPALVARWVAEYPGKKLAQQATPVPGG
jgi:hypothetical protein